MFPVAFDCLIFSYIKPIILQSIKRLNTVILREKEKKQQQRTNHLIDISHYRHNINHCHSLGKFSRQQTDDIFSYFSQKTGLDFLCKLSATRNHDLTFHANCFHWWQFAWNITSCFLGKISKIFQCAVCWKFYPACLVALSRIWPQLTTISIVMVNCCEFYIYTWGSLDRSGRVLVASERSDRWMTFLVMFKTVRTMAVLQGFARIFFIRRTFIILAQS